MHFYCSQYPGSIWAVCVDFVERIKALSAPRFCVDNAFVHTTASWGAQRVRAEDYAFVLNLCGTDSTFVQKVLWRGPNGIFAHGLCAPGETFAQGLCTPPEVLVGRGPQSTRDTPWMVGSRNDKSIVMHLGTWGLTM